MSYLNETSYESSLQAMAGELQAEAQKRGEKFEALNKANEIVKTLGEAKTYLSGKPVLSYLYTKASTAVKGALDKAGVDTDEIEGATEAQSGDVTAAAAASEEAESGYLDTAPTAELSAYTDVAPVATEQALVADRGMQAISTANNYGNIGRFGEGGYSGTGFTQSLFESPTSGLRAQGELVGGDELGVGARVGQPATDSGGTGYLDVRPEGNDPYLDVKPDADADMAGLGDADATTGSTTAIEGASTRAVAGDVRAGVAAGGEDEAVGEGAELASEEAGLGALDAIPGADILGLIGGIGLTIYSLAKKPHEHPPVDKVNTSFQPGL